MCDIGKALSRAFSPPGTGQLLNNLQGQQSQAERSADTAYGSLEDALSKLRDASLPVLDNPFALAAQRSQMAKLMGQQGSAFTFRNTPTAAPMTGTKILMGA